MRATPTEGAADVYPLERLLLVRVEFDVDGNLDLLVSLEVDMLPVFCGERDLSRALYCLVAFKDDMLYCHACLRSV